MPVLPPFILRNRPEIAGLRACELIELVLAENAQGAALMDYIAQREQTWAKNSRNSSKPPSTDAPWPKPAPAPAPSLNDGVKRTSGGQPGHKGSTLHRVANPDEVIEYSLPATCECGLALQGVLGETRQSFDIPKPVMRVTEHRGMQADCACGRKHRSAFPANVRAAVQYGEVTQAMAALLTQRHAVSASRCAEILSAQTGHGVSQGAILGMVQSLAQVLAPEVEKIKEAIAQAPVVCADETGLRVGGALKWLHGMATPLLTWAGMHDNRGKAAMDAHNVLPRLKGTVVHDGLAAYRSFDVGHALCNAHHLRELVGVEENFKQPWATAMIDFLLRANEAVKANAGTALALTQQAELRAEYDDIVAGAQALNPPSEVKGKSGRARQSVPFNLLKRLANYADDVLRFTRDPAVPFTNNQAERIMRMPKVKQKVSGCFRTPEGADNYCIFHSYGATVTKHKLNLFDALTQAARGSPLAFGLG